MQDLIKEVDIEHIIVNRFQPRKEFSLKDLEELSLSIRTVGIIHPPVVRPAHDHFFEIISGERRVRASQMAGLKYIPVVVRTSTHLASAQAALIENLQRVDLNPIEIALAFKSIMEEFGLNQEDLAMRLGKKRSSISNYLRVLTLPKGIQESVSKDLISLGHAKVILSLQSEKNQHLLHELILRDDLSVREAEKIALKLSGKVKKEQNPPELVNRNFYLEQLAEKLQHKLGTKVVINGDNKGRISIEYYNLDDLDRVLGIFGVN